MESLQGGCLKVLCLIQCVFMVLSATTTTTTTTKATTTTSPTTTTPPTTTPTTTTTTEAPYLEVMYPNLTSRAPNKTARIAIIGGTITGVHMALSLMDAGFKDVNVYETSHRLGGEGFSVYFDAQTFLLGETFLFDEEQGTAAALNKRFESTSLVQVPNPDVWISSDKKLSFMDYLFHVAKKFHPALTSDRVIKKYQDLLAKYKKAVKANFGDYDGHVMARPLDRDLKRLNKTFLIFLRNNNIEALKSLFQIVLTSVGAGDITTLPALYGCMFINQRMATVLSEKLGSNTPLASVFKKGIQYVIEDIVKMNGIDVKLDYETNEIERHPDGYYNLYYRKKYVKTEKKKKKCSKGYFKRKFDHIFIAVEPREFLPYLRDPDPTLKAILNELSVSYNTYNLIRTNRSSSTIQNEHFAFNSYDDFNVRYCLDSQPGLNTKTIPESKYSVCLQESAVSNRSLLAEKMYSHIQEMNYNLMNPASNTSVQETLKLFQRWEAETFDQTALIGGNLWKLLHIQGKDSLWYISRAASLGYSDVVFDYNIRLLKQMGVM